MNAAPKSPAGTHSSAELAALMDRLGRDAAAAAGELALATTATRICATKMAAALRARRPELLAANAGTWKRHAPRGCLGMLDRLALDEAELRTWRAVSSRSALADPIGSTIAQWTRPSRLDIARAVPLGVIGIICEPPQRDLRCGRVA
jgi:glutamate-5-semialdehyde dehydrogenase